MGPDGERQKELLLFAYFILSQNALGKRCSVSKSKKSEEVKKQKYKQSLSQGRVKQGRCLDPL